ncbi:MAG TPA: hypothetical protein VF800_10840 [Telluria sp.]|jgi:hypothetical protein
MGVFPEKSSGRGLSVGERNNIALMLRQSDFRMTLLLHIIFQISISRAVDLLLFRLAGTLFGGLRQPVFDA